MKLSGIILFLSFLIISSGITANSYHEPNRKYAPIYQTPDFGTNNYQNVESEGTFQHKSLIRSLNNLQKPEVTIINPEKDWQKTNQMEMNIEARIKYIYSELDVICTVNGQSVEFEFFYDKIKFLADLQLGTNVIKIVANNEEGSTNDIKRVVYDPAYLISKSDLPSSLLIGAPVVEMVAPVEKLTKSEVDIYSIQAYLENVEKKEDIKFTANDMELTGFRFDPILGSLTIKVRLAEGDNDFVIIAKNTKGRAEKAFTIQYGVIDEEPAKEEEVVTAPPEEKKEPEDVEYEEVVITDDSEETPEKPDAIAAPKVQLLYPATNPFFSKQEKVLIQAKITGIKSESDIDFVIDGKRNIFFDYDEVTSVLRYELQLIGEETEIRIAARNAGGTDYLSLKVYFGEDPVIKYDDKEQKIVFEQISEPEMYCLTHFEVKINVLADKEDIELELNGNQVGNFMYGKSESKMRFSLYLYNGKNVVSVSVNNNIGKFKADTILECFDYESEYEEEIKIEEPASIVSVTPETGTTTKEGTVILQIKTGNIQRADEIKVMLNEKIVPNVEFDEVNSLAQVMLNLIPKNNQIYVGAFNEFGGEEVESLIYYDKQYTQAPGISINAPRNGFNSEKDKLMFKADVSFVNELSGVEVYLNKKRVRDFDYNEDLGRIQALLDLNLGKNILEVKAQNNIGESVETITFTYKVRLIPAVQILQPKEGLEYKDKIVSLQAVVQNVSNSSGITLTVNGKKQPPVNFDKTREEVNARITLTEGENNIVLTAKNDNGSASASVKLKVRGALKKPEISMINPSKSEITVSENLLKFEAVVKEIFHSSQVDLSVNGQIIEEVYFYKENNRVKADIPLTKGKNTIKIIASNDSGLENATFIVNYR